MCPLANADFSCRIHGNLSVSRERNRTFDVTWAGASMFVFINAFISSQVRKTTRAAISSNLPNCLCWQIYLELFVQQSTGLGLCNSSVDQLALFVFTLTVQGTHSVTLSNLNCIRLRFLRDCDVSREMLAYCARMMSPISLKSYKE